MLTTDSTDTGVSLKTHGHVATLTLNRPPANRLAPDMMNAMREALLSAEADPQVRVLVLTGSGQTFCGGLDGERIRNGGNPTEFAQALVELLRTFPKLGVPTIAAVNGDAVASGFSLVCACDVSVAVSQAKLGTIEASMNLWPVIAQVPVLQRLPARAAIQNVFTGVPFTADEAYRMLAINEVVPDSRVLSERVDSWVERLTKSGTTSAGRRAFYEMRQSTWDEALDHSLELFQVQQAQRAQRA
jgi:enoyl-CoA hydratase/carnithine racemase